ncbi:MAG: YfhO family protein [Candidatus Omnitrophica bacterium]|nr:YfhO family protein [Candidatus Omnitrophota bacterium]
MYSSQFLKTQLNKRGSPPFIDFCILTFLNLVIYHEYWFLYKLFTGADFFRQLVPLINYQSDCLREFSLPLWNPFMNFGYPWVDHYLSSFLFPTHLVVGFLVRYTVEIAQLEILAWRLLGGFGIYLCVNECGYSRRTAIISAVSFMFSGQLIALVSWSNQVYNAACFPFLLLGYLKAKKSKTVFSFITISFLAMSILGRYIASSVLALYFFIGYVVIDSFISKKPIFGIKFLSVALVLSFLLTSPKLLPLYRAIKTNPRLSSVGPSHVNLGIISYYELMSFLLPVKYYFSVYIGEILIIALIYAVLKRRAFKFNGFFWMAFLSMWFLLVDKNGNVSVLRSIANSRLPFMKAIRLEFLYWYYPLIFVILYISQFLDGFFDRKIDRAKFFAVGLFIVLLSILFFSNFNTSLYYRAYIIHVDLSLLWLFSSCLYKQRGLQTILILVLLTVEFWIVFNRVNIDEPPIRRGKYMEIILSHQNNTSRSFRDGELVRERWKLRVTRDYLRPTLRESKNWPYLELGAVEKERFWLANPVESMNQKRFTGIWYNHQETCNFIRLQNSAHFKKLGKKPLFLFMPYKSRKSIYSVRFDKISGSSFIFTVDSKDKGMFVLRQMYDKRWRVFVDDKEQKLLKANDFFMGVEIEPGSHKIEFIFHDKYFNLALMVSITTFIGILIRSIMRKKLLSKI